MEKGTVAILVGLVFIILLVVVGVGLYILLFKPCPEGQILSGGRCVTSPLIPVTPLYSYSFLGLLENKIVTEERFIWQTFTGNVYNEQTGNVISPLTGNVVITFAFEREASQEQLTVTLINVSTSGSMTSYSYSLSPSSTTQSLTGSIELPVEQSSSIGFDVRGEGIVLVSSGTYATVFFHTLP